MTVLKVCVSLPLIRSDCTPGCTLGGPLARQSTQLASFLDVLGGRSTVGGVVDVRHVQPPMQGAGYAVGKYR